MNYSLPFARLLCLGLLCASAPIMANCTKVTGTGDLSSEAIAAGYTATGWFGAYDDRNANIGLPSVISVNSGSHLQPSGTLLASSIGNFVSHGNSIPYTNNQILFRCQLADAGKLYEMYATNGDNEFTGREAVTEVEGAYYDVFKNVAVRMTNLSTGEYYSRYWKARALTADDWYQDSNYIYIPASAFSNVLYEVFKIDSTTHAFNRTSYYWDTYMQPRGYIAFKGPGLDTDALQPGADHRYNYQGWHHHWPGVWGTYRQVTWIRGAFCQINDYPSHILFPTTSVSALQEGGNVQIPFTVTIECESGAISSTSASSSSAANVAMGFLVNQSAAAAAAQTLGLTTSTGGLTWLLDSQYGSSGVASGVGIRIYDSSGAALNLLPSLAKASTGNAGGWYAYKDITSLTSSGDTNIYSGDFTASLEAIDGQTVTAGSINAQLQVVISFQ